MLLDLIALGSKASYHFYSLSNLSLDDEIGIASGFKMRLRRKAKSYGRLGLVCSGSEDFQ